MAIRPKPTSGRRVFPAASRAVARFAAAKFLLREKRRNMAADYVDSPETLPEKP
jgi:hypothetical protein